MFISIGKGHRALLMTVQIVGGAQYQAPRIDHESGKLDIPPPGSCPDADHRFDSVQHDRRNRLSVRLSPCLRARRRSKQISINIFLQVPAGLYGVDVALMDDGGHRGQGDTYSGFAGIGRFGQNLSAHRRELVRQMPIKCKHILI